MKVASDIICPVCLAQPGEDCLPSGRTHQERFDAAVRANELTGLWRSAAAVAEERTAAIDAGRAPAPVVDAEPDGAFVFPAKERGKC